MKDALAALDHWQQEGEQIAVATLIRVRGSAPRSPGARLCVTRSGRMAGSVSGGCVESDVFERAMQVIDSGEPAVATYGITEEWAIEVGLSCGGAIDVLIEPFSPDAAWQAARESMRQQHVVTLGVALSPPALRGRKLAIAEDQTTIGSIDSILDRVLANESRALTREGGTRVLTLPWRGEEASVFLEAFLPPPRLFIIGATHTAMVLSRMAKALDFRVIIIDARAVYATDERFPDADTIFRAPPGEVLQQSRLDRYSHVVILTHDPKFDIPALACALRSDARYVGVMGSRKTHAHRRAKLLEQGITDTDLSRIRAPIGLDIGARTPDEVALAILAEIVAVQHARAGSPLSEKTGSVHGER